MGFDETRERLIGFREALSDFIEVLQQTDAENQAAAERLAGHWDDTFSSGFNRRLLELVGPVADFTGRDAQRYLAYLDDQIAGFGRYLDGQ